MKQELLHTCQSQARSASVPPATTSRGSARRLNGYGSFDAEQSTGALTYQWDLDGDGIFGETGAGTVRGDEPGIALTFSATVLNESVRTVALMVTDNAGAVLATTCLSVDLQKTTSKVATDQLS